MPGMSGSVVLVTGASRGIGAAIALHMGSLGASVAVNYAGSEAAALSIVQQIRDSGGDADVFQADIADSAACTALVAAVVERFGGLDVVVNNAGIARDGLLVRMSDEDWDAVIRTNLTGVFAVTRAAGKVMMKARAGSIVNVSSVIGLVGNAGQANYAA
ncbi:MAG: SDR family NAD(P)-dependent oxidoreductase, partial [Actinomycetota bacterium]|nr:SDR family NAD(P)-dependent oxidoreductase [Actinomycetota bacterium]